MTGISYFNNVSTNLRVDVRVQRKGIVKYAQDAKNISADEDINRILPTKQLPINLSFFLSIHVCLS